MYAPVTEIFSSIQGEGIFLGQRQIFIRFRGCNISCDYCDEKEKKDFSNLSIEEAVNKVERLNGHKRKDLFFISLTGGEPLLYADYLKKLLPRLRRKSFKIYLEANGLLPENLKKIIALVDVVAMDIKLPSAVSQKKYWEIHREFLKIAQESQVFVKIVVTGKTKEEEIKKAVGVVKKINPAIPLVLQPVTPYGKVRFTIKENNLLRFKKIAKSRLKTVKILPQMHKIVGIK